jgi:MFS family permease
MFKQNRNLFFIALIAVVNALGYGIVIPILYSYSKKFGLTDFENGLLFSLFSICAFLSTPLIGRMSDKYGRRPLLIISIIGTTLSFFMQAFAPNAFFLFLARALDGLTAGNISVAQAVISDTTASTPQDRARAFGIIGASFGFGFVFGPAISAVTVKYSPALPFIIAGVISAIAAVVTYIFLEETNKHIGEVEHKKLFDFAKLWHALIDPNVGTTLLITLVYFLAFACAIIYGFQPFAKNVLHTTDTQLSILFVVFGLVGLVTQIFLVGRVTKYFGIKKAFSWSIFIVGISMLMMFASRSLLLFIAASMVLGIANSLVQPLTNTILSQETDEKSQGSIMGINASYMSIGQIFGPIIGGAIATIYIPGIFIVGFLLIMVCLYLSTKVLRPGIKKESAF